jgi:cholesterol transport system auxiliary component
MKTTWLAAAWLAAAVAVPSCTLRQPAVLTENYALSLPAARPGPTGPRSIAVQPFTAAPMAAGQMLLYRAEDLRYESDYYNRFLTPPERMLTDGLRRWLMQSRAGEVREPGAPLAADLMVQGRLTELYADYRKLDEPRAVVAMVMVLVERDPAGNRQVLEKTYRRAVPMKEVSPRAAVQGWREGVAGIFGEFTRDLRAAR